MVHNQINAHFRLYFENDMVLSWEVKKIPSSLSEHVRVPDSQLSFCNSHTPSAAASTNIPGSGRVTQTVLQKSEDRKGKVAKQALASARICGPAAGGQGIQG